MNSNIIKKNTSSSDIRNLCSLVMPTQLHIGSNISGKSNGIKKYLKIIYESHYSDMASITADGRELTLHEQMSGFTNNLGVKCGDSIVSDDDNQKVSLYKYVYRFKLKDVVQNFELNNVCDTHSTFELNTAYLFDKNEKKEGLSNIYCTHFITHLQQSSQVYSSGIIGDENNEYIYIKIKADDEKYFYNGERITDVETFKKWIAARDVTIVYERKHPIITDITGTSVGQMLLSLNPGEDFLWNTSNAVLELCVYRNIDEVLDEIRALILE